MLLFYSGNDFEKKQKKIDSVLRNLKSKKENSNFLHYDSFDLSDEKLRELLKSQGLFEEKNIVLLTNIFYNKDLKKWILENLEEFQKSESAFIFSEENLTAAEIKKIEKFAYKIEEFKKTEKKENLFPLADYIQEKNIKKAWTFYQEALKKNILADEIFPIIFWGVKNLVLVEKKDLKESGLKSFVYNKAKRNLKNWKKNEANEKLFELAKMHSESRKGKIKFKNSLEKFILGLK